MNYKVLFSLQMLHAYFAHSQGPGYRFETTKSTQKQMAKCSILIKRHKHYCQVVQDIHKLDSIRETLNFDFLIYPQDPLFYVYSDITFEERGKEIYFIENRESKEIDKGLQWQGPQLLEHSTGNRFGALVVQQKTKRFFFTPVEPQGVQDMSLINKNNQVLQEWNIGSNSKDTGLFVDVSNQPDGLFNLMSEGKIVERFFVYEPIFPNVPPVILRINMDVDENQSASPKKFEIQWPNRSVYWSYRIKLKNININGENLSIRNGNDKNLTGISFNRANGKNINQQEIRFNSNVPIPLLERSYNNISLVDKNRADRPLVSHLPNPSLKNVKYRDNSWMAHVFITL